jgi:hypothetical protein
MILDRITEFTFPVHDPPAVWKSWGLRGGGLPIVEALPGAPVTKPRYGATADDGLPTLYALAWRSGQPAVLDHRAGGSE